MFENINSAFPLSTANDGVAVSMSQRIPPASSHMTLCVSAITCKFREVRYRTQAVMLLGTFFFGKLLLSESESCLFIPPAKGAESR